MSATTNALITGILCMVFTSQATLLKGRIVDSDSLTPISGIELRLKSDGRILGYTNIYGEFQIDFLPNTSIAPSRMQRNSLQYNFSDRKVYNLNGSMCDYQFIMALKKKAVCGVYIGVDSDGVARTNLKGKSINRLIGANKIEAHTSLSKKALANTEHVILSKLGYLDTVIIAELNNEQSVVQYGDIPFTSINKLLAVSTADSAQKGSVTIDGTTYDAYIVLLQDGGKEVRIYKGGEWIDLRAYIDESRNERAERCGPFYTELCNYIYTMSDTAHIEIVLALAPDCIGYPNCDKSAIAQSVNKLVSLDGFNGTEIQDLGRGEIKVTLSKSQLLILKEMSWVLGGVAYEIYAAGPSKGYGKQRKVRN